MARSGRLAIATMAVLFIQMSVGCGDSSTEPTTLPPDAPTGPVIQPGSGAWEFFPDLKLPLGRFGAAAYDGTIYVVGGVTQVGVAEVLQNAVYRFDWQLNTWDSLATFPVSIADHGVAVLGDTLYVVGGFVSGGNPLNALWAYEPDMDTWDTRPPMPAVRSGAAVGVGDGRLLVVGGFDAVDGDMLAYSQATGAWTREPGPDTRLDAAVVEAAGVVYQTGGRGWNGSVAEITPAPQVFGRNPGTGQWSQVAEQPRVRRTPATATLGSLVHFVGGQDLSRVQGTHMGWDPTVDQWYEFADLSPERTDGVAVVLDGALYVIGGRTRTGISDRVDKFVRP